MELTRSRAWRAEAAAGTWKDGSWKKANLLDKQKVCKDEDFHELELKIKQSGLIGNMGAKNEKGPQSHPTKEKSQAKHSGMLVSGDGKTPFEQLNKDARRQYRNKDVLTKCVTVERPINGPQLNASYRFSSGTGAGVKVKSVLTQNQLTNPLPRHRSSAVEALPSDTSPSGLSVSDYLVLLKSLRINLPSGVLNAKVIRLSQNAGIIQKAQDIVKKLENFKLKFNSVPRLGCREIKNSLSLKDNQKVLEITVMIFFEKTEDSEQDLRAQWKKNISNSKCGFSFRDKYNSYAISTPALYATTQTRSWKHLEVGDKSAEISAGVTVNVRDIENRDYCDESALWTTSSPRKFGKYFQNPTDELECLKFYHELQEIGTNKKVRYTRGNKVEFGFLSGRLDFLAEVEKSEKTVIECKGTTGDMVGKVFTKPKNGRCAHLIETHEYCYQVQAYMYILNREEKQTKSFTSDRAVMVIRHYHKNGREPRDFYWNYLSKNEAIQQKIDELRVFCEEEVLACFLAVLNLIFQKDT